MVPLISERSAFALFKTWGISLVKSTKEWIAIYQGKPIATISLKHQGERGIKIKYMWTVLREKLKKDGFSGDDFVREEKRLEREAMGYA